MIMLHWLIPWLNQYHECHRVIMDSLGKFIVMLCMATWGWPCQEEGRYLYCCRICGQLVRSLQLQYNSYRNYKGGCQLVWDRWRGGGSVQRGWGSYQWDRGSQHALTLSHVTSKASSWPKATQEGEASADVATTGGIKVEDEPGPPTAVELGEKEESAHRAFWTLLKQVDYEDW